MSLLGVRIVTSRMFRSLRARNYRRYVFGHAVSVIGTWMQRVGQDWLVLELTHSGVALGACLALQFLPVLLGGVWGGVVVDRRDKRKLIIATQATQAVLAAVLAVVTLTDVVNLPTVFVMAFLLGVVSVFDVPARQAFVSELVGPDDVVNAMALASLVHNTGRLVGPAVGGLLIAATSVGVTFAVNAVSFIAVLIGLLMIDPRALHRGPPVARAPGQARAGLKYVWERPDLRMIMLLVAFVAVFGQNFRVVLPLFAAETFDGDARTYGLLTSMLGLGAVIGALVSAAASRPTTRGLFISCGIFGVANLAAAAAPVFGVALVAMVVIGGANIVFNTFARTLLQLRSDRSLHGRVMAIHSLVFLGSTPIGAPLLGLVCAVSSARVGLAVAAVFSLVPAGVLLLTSRQYVLVKEPA
jgi:MFS family permease